MNDPNVNYIDKKFLTRYDSFNQFMKKTDNTTVKEAFEENQQTPLEIIDSNYNLLKKDLQDELLDKILECTPAFFEQLIVRLIVAMRYGGSVKDAGETIGKSGKGDIDGIIKEDVLGLEMIYLRAKRWKKRIYSFKT